MWSTPYVLGSGTISSALRFDVASDAAGNVIVVFEKIGGAAKVKQARFTPAAGFAAAADLGNGADQRIAAEPNGVMLAAWYDGSAGALRVRRYIPGSGFAPPLVLTALYGAVTSDLAVNELGEGVAALWSITSWAHRVGGAGVGPKLDFADVRFTGSATLGIDRSGNVLATWIRSDVVPHALLARRISPADALDPIVTLDSGSIAQPMLRLDTTGSGLTLWRRGGDRIISRRLIHNPASRQCPESWTWGAGVELGAAPAPLDSHALAVAPSGGSAVAVWQEAGNGGPIRAANFY